MSRLLFFLFKNAPFKGKIRCLHTILHDFGVQPTDPLRTAYGLNKPEYCVPKKRRFHPPKTQSKNSFQDIKNASINDLMLLLWNMQKVVSCMFQIINLKRCCL